MNKMQKIIAGIGGLGVLALAIWVGTILFVALLVIVPLLALYGRWRMGKMRKEFEKRRAAGDKSVIETDYVVVEETRPLDERAGHRHQAAHDQRADHRYLHYPLTYPSAALGVFSLNN